MDYDKPLFEEQQQRQGPTDSQIKTILSDWLGGMRQGQEGGYVHQGRGGIDFTGQSITDFIVGSTDRCDTLDLIKKSVSGARNIIGSIVHEPITLSVGGQESMHIKLNEQTKNNNINLATDFFDEESLTNHQKASIFLGLACHEASHAAFTDSDIEGKMLERTPKSLQELKHEIWNIIEDERIEHLLGEDSPGFAPLLAETKRYYYGRFEKDILKDDGEPKEVLPRLINNLLRAVRFPSSLREKEIMDHFDELDAIRKALYPYPLTAEGACEAADRVIDIIGHLVHKDQKKKQQQENKTPGEEGNNAKGEKQSQKNDNSQASGNGQNEAPSPDDIQKALEDALNTDEAKKVMKALKKNRESGTENDSRQHSSSVLNLDPAAEKYANDETAEKMSGSGKGFNNRFLFKPKGDAKAYLEIAKSVQKYVPAMSKALACKTHDSEFINRGMPSGKLNTNKLVSYKMGGTNLFDKRGEVHCSSASVCLLVDESSSMRGSKNEMTKKAAVLVNETIKRISNVNYYCYGYNSNGLRIYAEQGKTSRWGISDISAHGSTPTGEAMEEISKRIRKMTANPVLLLVLTDGSAYDTDLVIKMDEKLSKEGFIVIGVGIQTSYVKHSFKKSISIEDISQMPFLIGQLTKKNLDKMLVTSISQ